MKLTNPPPWFVRMTLSGFLILGLVRVCNCSILGEDVFYSGVGIGLFSLIFWELKQRVRTTRTSPPLKKVVPLIVVVLLVVISGCISPASTTTSSSIDTHSSNIEVQPLKIGGLYLGSSEGCLG